MTDSVDIILPEGQLEGTSATMATWLVKVGDSVKEGDPVAELETDKVVMEICATASGQIESLITKVGDEVETNQILGSISTQVLATVAETAPQQQASAADSEGELNEDEINGIESTPQDEEARQFVSPAVRRLLRENDLSIEPIPGTGKRGRVTRDDVLNFLKDPQSVIPRKEPKITSEEFTQAKQAETVPTESVPTNGEQIKARQPAVTPYSIPERQSRELAGNLVPHSKMRKSIASHMVESLLHTSPHVTSVFEMDMTNIIEHRKWHKKEFEELGVKLTFTAYFLAAMVKAVQAVPQVNARFHEDALEIFDDVNIGVGTALGDAGLVVPVVEQVQQMNLFEIAHRLNLQTIKARDGKLTPADMRNGTITISNHGVSGSLFAAPIIINQPEVAILGIGKLEKRVVVEEVNGVDTMVIRPKCYVSLSIDHRALDAHQTNQFLSVFVDTIENWGQ